jgi:hypothetical protein
MPGTAGGGVGMTNLDIATWVGLAVVVVATLLVWIGAAV